MAIDPKKYNKVYDYLNIVSPLSIDIWEKICELLIEKSFNVNEFFAIEGRKEYKVGILLSGVFRSFIYDDKDNEFTKTIYTPITYKTPISFLGAYTSLVTGEINSINLQAIKNAKVLVCSYKSLDNLGKTNIEIADWLIKLSNLFFAGKEKRVLELGTMTALQRYSLFKEQFPELEGEINQYYIAQYIGVTPTQLSRIRRSYNNFL